MIISSNALHQLAVVRRYLDLLAGGEARAAAALFSASAVVQAPPAPARPAAVFFADAALAPGDLHVRDAQLFVSASGSPAVCALFMPRARRGEDASSQGPCVDVFEFDEQGCIDRLTIVRHGTAPAS